MITVKLACGHGDIQLDPTSENRPTCPTCGERRVRHVVAPPPRFSGLARGPHAVGGATDPRGTDLTTAGPLRLKAQG